MNGRLQLKIKQTKNVLEKLKQRREMTHIRKLNKDWLVFQSNNLVRQFGKANWQGTPYSKQANYLINDCYI